MWGTDEERTITLKEVHAMTIGEERDHFGYDAIRDKYLDPEEDREYQEKKKKEKIRRTKMENIAKGENEMADNNKMWCDIINPDKAVKGRIKKLYAQARKKGHSKLEIKAAFHTFIDLSLYEAELDEAFTERITDAKERWQK